MKRFVHKAGTCIRIHQHLDASFDFGIIPACEGFHHNAHGPHHVIADMRSADTLAGFAAEEIGIAVAPHKTAGILINGVIDIYISQIGHGKQAGYIGIVHQQMIAETINLESIDGTEFRMVVGCIAFQSHLHLIGQGTAVGSQGSLLVHCFQNLGSLAQRSDGKEVGRHKELKRCGIVRRAEAGHDESHRTDRSTQTVIVQRIERTLRLALEFVGTDTLFALLLTKVV